MNEPTCPTCGRALELYANGDDGAHRDRWTCEACGIEYPYSEFPLPSGYAQARAAERAAERMRRKAEDRRRLAAWNVWNRRYAVIVTGKTLEAMAFLSRWVLDNWKEPLPFPVIAACDHVFSWPNEVRAGEYADVLMAVTDVIAANERLCACINEFEPDDAAACSEYQEQLDMALARLAARTALLEVAE